MKKNIAFLIAVAAFAAVAGAVALSRPASAHYQQPSCPVPAPTVDCSVSITPAASATFPVSVKISWNSTGTIQYMYVLPNSIYRGNFLMGTSGYTVITANGPDTIKIVATAPDGTAHVCQATLSHA